MSDSLLIWANVFDSFSLISALFMPKSECSLLSCSFLKSNGIDLLSSSLKKCNCEQTAPVALYKRLKSDCEQFALFHKRIILLHFAKKKRAIRMKHQRANSNPEKNWLTCTEHLTNKHDRKYVLNTTSIMRRLSKLEGLVIF